MKPALTWTPCICANWSDLIGRPHTYTNGRRSDLLCNIRKEDQEAAALAPNRAASGSCARKAAARRSPFPMPTPAEVKELPGETTLANLDTPVGRNVVGAVLVHCIYACTAIPEDRPLTHVVGEPHD